MAMKYIDKKRQKPPCVDIIDYLCQCMKGLIPYTINVGGRLLDLSEPLVMGILNATPDSFYAGSRRQTEEEIASRASQIVAEGGAIIDVGAYSTRPGAAKVTAGEEMERMRMALKAVRMAEPEAVVSVDTFRPEVARMSVEEYGAAIINDVSGGNVEGAFGGEEMLESAYRGVSVDDAPPIFVEAARLGAPYILMSSRPNIVSIMQDFAPKVQLLRDLGQKDIILDPGFGFGKTLDENYEVLARMGRLREMGLPVLAGVSRKSMISRVLGTDAAGALTGTVAANVLATVLGGASILRVHDVKECVEAVKIVKETMKYWDVL